MTDDTKKPTVTISLIELARKTSVWSDCYDICCQMHSAYQKLEQELKEMHFAYAKAKTELYEAKAEIERLSVKLHEANMSIPVTNHGWPYEKRLHEQIQSRDVLIERLVEIIKRDHVPRLEYACSRAGQGESGCYHELDAAEKTLAEYEKWKKETE